MKLFFTFPDFLLSWRIKEVKVLPLKELIQFSLLIQFVFLLVVELSLERPNKRRLRVYQELATNSSWSSLPLW